MQRDPEPPNSGASSQTSQQLRRAARRRALASLEPDPALIEQVNAAPKVPGCYIFRDAADGVLYVGKAKVLRNRVKSYLRPEADGRYRIPFMVREARRIEYVITSNEKEALVLENNLIKIHKPRYNISLKDDRTYVSVRLDLRHPWPRAQVVHKYKKDGATYVGPFASGAQLRIALEAVKRIYPLRRCTDHVLRNRTRVCVYYDVGICAGPCVAGNVTTDQYREMVDGLLALLKGKDLGALRRIEAEMQAASERQDYELAALLRDQVFAVRATIESQNAQLAGRKTINRDVIGLHREGESIQIQVLLYRDDRLVGSTTHNLSSGLPDDEVIEQFCARYYEGDRPIPPEVLLPVDVDDAVSLGLYVSDKAGYQVTVSSPKRGEKSSQVRLACVNARHAMLDRESQHAQVEATIGKLQESLGLVNLPRRMECYDISHLQGEETVGSGVCFVDGKPDKQRYRRYKLRTVDGNDDFAAMEEVLTRRLKRGLEEADFPDLIVIDGGPAQLSRVQQVFDRLNIVGVDLIGLAKSRDKSAPAWVRGHASKGPEKVTDERVFLPGESEPITLSQQAPELFLLMRLRDEAHRFAITFNRERRQKAAVSSGLDSVDGIGPKRKRALIQAFGSPAGILEAGIEAVSALPGMNRKLADAVISKLGGNPPQQSEHKQVGNDQSSEDQADHPV